jgi:hypothetical protein
MEKLIEKYRGMRLDCSFRINEVEQKKAKAGHDPRLSLTERKEKRDELEWIQVALQSEMKVIDMFLEDLETI